MANLILVLLASVFFLPGIAASSQSYEVDVFQITHNETREVIVGIESGTGDMFWKTISTDPSFQSELFRFNPLAGESIKICSLDQSQIVRGVSPNNDVLYQLYNGTYSLYLKNSYLQQAVLLSKSSVDGDMNDRGDVVWSEESNIFFYDYVSSSIVQIPSPVVSNYRPLIDNNQNIMWLGSALDGSSQVFRYSPSTGEIKQLSNFSSQEKKPTSLWINRNGDALWQRLTLHYSYVIYKSVLSYYKAEFYIYNAEANSSRMIFSLDTLDSQYSRFALQQNGDVVFTIPGPVVTGINDLYRYDRITSEISCLGRIYGSVAVSISDSGYVCAMTSNGFSMYDSQYKQTYNLMLPDSIFPTYGKVSRTGQIYFEGRQNQSISSLYELYLVNKPEIIDIEDITGGGTCADIGYVISDDTDDDIDDEVQEPLALTPGQLLFKIVSKIDELNVSEAMVNSYVANLNSAKQFVADEKITPAIKQIEAFNQKLGQDLKQDKISNEDAKDLMGMANQLLSLLNR